MGIRPAVGIAAAAAAAAALALILFQSATRDERELPSIHVAETPPRHAPAEPFEAPEVQGALEPEFPIALETTPDLEEAPPDFPQRGPEFPAGERAAEESVVVAETRPAAVQDSTPMERLSADAESGRDPIEDLMDLKSPDDLEVVEIALELDTLEDLDVIANLELLERWIALEEGTG